MNKILFKPIQQYNKQFQASLFMLAWLGTYTGYIT